MPPNKNQQKLKKTLEEDLRIVSRLFGISARGGRFWVFGFNLFFGGGGEWVGRIWSDEVMIGKD